MGGNSYLIAKLIYKLRQNAVYSLPNVLFLSLFTCSVTASQNNATPQNCTGKWSGLVSYKRSQHYTDNSQEERNSGRGTDSRSFQLDYEYQAKIKLAKELQDEAELRGKATISHRYTTVETISSIERNSCDNGKTWQQMSGEFTTKSQLSGKAAASGLVGIDIQDNGRYAISLTLPPIKGILSGSQSAEYSGQCDAVEGDSTQLTPTETEIEEVFFASDNSQHIDPNNPNRLSGSFTQNIAHESNTLAWELSRCKGELELQEMKFQHMQFPHWGKWVDIVPQKGTIDGNWVRISVKVKNNGSQSQTAKLTILKSYEGDKFNQGFPDSKLTEEAIEISVAAGEVQDVDFMWDSSGYAWFDDGRARWTQRIKVQLDDNNGQRIDELKDNIKIAPKPVVLVHGLWSNWLAWEKWQNYLTLAHSLNWRAYAVGQVANKGKMNTGGDFMSSAPTNTIFENSQQLGKYIEYAQHDANAWHVDLVAHSMGGLISRHYIHQFMPQNYQDGRPQVAHLVMLGTPNMGSPCADVMDIAFAMTGKNVAAIHELTTSVVAEFNKVNSERKGVTFSILAGDPYPVMCSQYVTNDGVVPVQSAFWNISDRESSSSMHTALTERQHFKGFVKPRLAYGPKDQDFLNFYQQSAKQNTPLVNNAEVKAISVVGAVTNNSPVSSLQASNSHSWTRQKTTNDISTMLGGVDKNNPSIQAQKDNEAPIINFAKHIEIAKRQSVQLQIPIGNSNNWGLAFTAAKDVSLRIFAESGALLVENEAGLVAAEQPFRSIFINKPIAAQTLSIQISNNAEDAREVVIATWSNAR